MNKTTTINEFLGINKVASADPQHVKFIVSWYISLFDRNSKPKEGADGKLIKKWNQIESKLKSQNLKIKVYYEGLSIGFQGIFGAASNPGGSCRYSSLDQYKKPIVNVIVNSHENGPFATFHNADGLKQFAKELIKLSTGYEREISFIYKSLQ